MLFSLLGAIIARNRPVVRTGEGRHVLNYYISDLHFGHQNVIRFDSRPFADVAQMAEALIENWNQRVTDEDTVYVLGDAFWKNEEGSVQIIQRLNGHKHLIRGNHDRIRSHLAAYWESIEDYAEIIDSGKLVILSHYPIPFYKNQRYGAAMLYGHVHNSQEWQLLEKWKREQWSLGIPCRLINVGCMMKYMNYTPRTLSELLVANPTPKFGQTQTSGMPVGQEPYPQILGRIQTTVCQLNETLDQLYAQYRQAFQMVQAGLVPEARQVEQLWADLCRFGDEPRFLELQDQVGAYICEHYPQLVQGFGCVYKWGLRNELDGDSQK